MTFDNPGATSAAIDAQSNTTIASPIAIADGEVLRISGSRPLELNGNIASATGDIVKDAANALTLGGNNAAWNGVLTINSGSVIVNHASALGSTIGETVLNGGTLIVNQPTAEPISFVAGTLQTAVSSLDFAGLLSLPAGNFALVRGPFELMGGSAGEGDLQLLADTAAPITISAKPLAHFGSLNISSAVSQRRFADFRIDNTYQGATNVDNVLLRTFTPQALGTAAAGTTVTNGELWLVPGSEEDVSLTNSTLNLWRGNTALPENQIEGVVTLSSSTLTAKQDSGGAPKYTIINPVVLAGGANAIAPERGEITLQGVVGQGDLLLNAFDDIRVVAPLAHQGKLEFRGGPIHLAAPNVVTGTVIVHNGGQLLAEADQQIERVHTGPRDESCCHPYGWIEAAPGVSLEINRLDVSDGMLIGDIRTPGPIEFFNFGTRDIRNLVSNVDVKLHAGQMRLDDSSATLGSTSGKLMVERESEAQLNIANVKQTVVADMHLGNGTGFGYGGALRFENDSSGAVNLTVQGDIHLGDRGAAIGGSARVRMEGDIYGGDLKLGMVREGGPAIQLVHPNPAYTGKTEIRGGELAIQQAGRLTNTERVEVKTNARFAVDMQPGDGPRTDRVADHVPIELDGGELSIWPSEWGIHSSERIGKVILKGGINNVRGTHFLATGRNSHADLIVGEISREPGSILRTASADRRYGTPILHDGYPAINDFVMENPPALVNGILPAWFLTWTGFSTYDANGRTMPYNGPTVTFAEANETSIVRPPSSASSLNRDLTVHAVAADGNVGPVDLGGHTLTVGSGGIDGGDFSNGTIRPGQHSGGELIFGGLTTLAASIVDNGTPTSVIYANDINVSGDNSYSGKTTVIGGPGTHVRVSSVKSLPAGGDVEVSDWSELNLRDVNGGQFQFGQVTIRNGGTLSSQCCNGLNLISAEQIGLQSGALLTRINGDTPIVKTTDGIAQLYYSGVNNEFTGTVDIHDGLLVTENYRAFGRSAVSVHENGRLAIQPTGSSPEYVVDVTLRGGALYGGVNPLDESCNLSGTLHVAEDSEIYLYNGTTTDQRGADINIRGSVQVAAGKTLEILGRSQIRFGPELRVTDGVHLAEGATLAGNGAIRGSVEISNGAILSPGSESMGASVGTFAMNRSVFIDEPISTMTWGENGKYDWEINDVEGEAGAVFGSGWDLTIARGRLEITATAADPFVIHLSSLAADGAQGSPVNLSPGDYRWQFLETDELVGFDPAKFVIDASGFDSSIGGDSIDLAGRALSKNGNAEFQLVREGNSLFILAHVVPEPSCMLSLLSLVMWAINSRFRGGRR